MLVLLHGVSYFMFENNLTRRIFGPKSVEPTVYENCKLRSFVIASFTRDSINA
jgi:hypothetical protein